jgi:hypothetical protein
MSFDDQYQIIINVHRSIFCAWSRVWICPSPMSRCRLGHGPGPVLLVFKMDNLKTFRLQYYHIQVSAISSHSTMQQFRAVDSVSDPISRSRKIIWKIYYSPARTQRLEEWITTGESWVVTLSKSLLNNTLIGMIGNINNRFIDNHGKIIQIPHKRLIRDINTRWISTFLMVKRFIEMRFVSYLFLIHHRLEFHHWLIFQNSKGVESFIKSPDSDISEDFLLSDDEWEKLVNFVASATALSESKSEILRIIPCDKLDRWPAQAALENPKF